MVNLLVIVDMVRWMLIVTVGIDFDDDDNKTMIMVMEVTTMTR